MRRRRLALPLPLALGLAMAACQGPQRETALPDASHAAAATPTELPGQLDEDYGYLLGKGEEPRQGGTILRHLESDASTLNPVLSAQVYETHVIRYLFDELYQFDGSLNIQPVLAAGLPEIDATGRVYTVKLKPGMRWHDGQPITARDVKFTLDMILDPEVPAVNLRAYFDMLERVDVVDDLTVKISWKQPFAPGLFSLTNVQPIPEHIYRTAKVLDFATQPANRKPVGSGPWRFVEWLSGQSITVEPNPDYWGEKPKVDKTIFKVIESRQVALKACRAGQLDDQLVPTEQWFTEAATPEFMAEFNRASYYIFGFSYINFNCSSKLFDDPLVRRALTMLQDRETIVKDLYRNTATVISGPFNPDTKWYDQSVKPWPFDPAGAAALLDEAGWKDTDGDGVRDKDGRAFDFELALPSGNLISEQLGTLLQENAARVGIKLSMRNYEGATFFEKLKKGELEASSQAWFLDPDPDWAYALFHSSQHYPVGANHSFYSDPETDRLLEAQRLELDESKRVELLHQVHRRLKEQSPYLFEIAVAEKRVFRKALRGVQINPMGPFLVAPGAEQWWLARGVGTVPE